MQWLLMHGSILSLSHASSLIALITSLSSPMHQAGLPSHQSLSPAEMKLLLPPLQQWPLQRSLCRCFFLPNGATHFTTPTVLKSSLRSFHDALSAGRLPTQTFCSGLYLLRLGPLFLPFPFPLNMSFITSHMPPPPQPLPPPPQTMVLNQKGKVD